MGIEEDHEHLGEQLRKAMSSAMSTQPDVLVFMLRGSEIRDIMNEMARLTEAAAKEMSSADVNPKVTPIRRPRPVPVSPDFGLPPPPGYGPAFMDGPSTEMLEEQKNRTVQALLRHAKNCRFLAGHVEEDRFFRLSTNDLVFLGLANGHGPV